MKSVSVITRSVEAVTEVSKKGLVRAIISDDSKDRYKTVFDPFGCDWAGFMAAGGPVVYEHGKLAERGNLPVANVANLEHGKFKGRNCIIAESRFWDTDQFSRTIKDAYESMRMRGWSVCALPRDASPPTYAEKRARDEWADAQTVYRDWELLDLSVCSTPGNSNTLTLEVMRSLASGAPYVHGSLTRAQALQLVEEFRLELRKAAVDAAREAMRIIRQGR